MGLHLLHGYLRFGCGNQFTGDCCLLLAIGEFLLVNDTDKRGKLKSQNKLQTHTFSSCSVDCIEDALFMPQFSIFLGDKARRPA